MAKKKFKMFLPFPDDPLFEERRILINKSWNLLWHISTLRKMVEDIEFLIQTAKTDTEKDFYIQQQNIWRAELASMEIKMARVNASIRKLNKDIKSE